MSLEDLPMMGRYALVLAFLGLIDTLLTSLIADIFTRTQHRSDRELVGQGIGNMASGLFGGIPGPGATMRTVVNVRAAGRIVLFHLEGPMSFGSAKGVTRMLASSAEREVLVIDLSDVPFIDSSASIALEEAIQDADGDVVVLCDLRPKVAGVLERIGVTALLPADRLAGSREEALRRAEEALARR